MSGCTAITQGGGRCKGTAIDSSGLCHAHHPDRAEQRSRAARKGGIRGGRGRPQVELADLKREVRAVIGGVLTGRIAHGPGAVALQGYNTLLRAAKVEMDIREQAEIIERIERLERSREEKGDASWQRRA
ncbi:MAG: hypothetical protein M3Q60_20430 [Actinomycetota bacterium]|nr:hypothetical protein [Actinomycetota bacterium]